MTIFYYINHFIVRKNIIIFKSQNEIGFNSIIKKIIMSILIVMMLHQLDILNIIKIIKYRFENSVYYNTINYLYKTIFVILLKTSNY